MFERFKEFYHRGDIIVVYGRKAKVCDIVENCKLRVKFLDDNSVWEVLECKVTRIILRLLR